jgi:hydroxymethylpyrimidine/phosphomethylpyrimidine kinase
MKVVLTIAGSDSSGGAGIQADIKTITAHKMFAECAITALTAQNTTGVFGVAETEPEFVGQQLDCIFKDITPDAVKIGMVSNSKIIEVIAQKLIEYKAKNIVLDPVMVATSGGKLMVEGASKTLKEKLFPLATVITPNIPEAEALSNLTIHSKEDMVKAAKVISAEIKGSVLIKGGHFEDKADDLLYEDGKEIWYTAKKIDTQNTHGTGCTLSSSIACNLAKGLNLSKAVKNAKKYITGAIKANLVLGHGNGPLNHMWNL